MPQTLKPNEEIELSSDQFSPIFDKNSKRFRSVRAVEPVPENGVYFYEVKIFGSAYFWPIHIGWATEEFFTSKKNDGVAIGVDHHSVGFNFSKESIWYQTKTKDSLGILDMTSTWDYSLGYTVVGCLIDVPAKNFIFYFDGQEFDAIKLNIDVHFSDMPYYPAASFQGDSFTKFDAAVHFNFGQESFGCYSPKNIHFNDFYGNPHFYPHHEKSVDTNNCEGFNCVII